MNSFDLKYQIHLQEERAKQMEKAKMRSAAIKEKEKEQAIASNDFRQASALGIPYQTYRNAHAEYIDKENSKMSDLDFEIGRNAFERYMHNPNDGEWARWVRDIREQQQKEHSS
jgi:hypothetical protein